jgi:hypothetical protein
MFGVVIGFLRCSFITKKRQLTVLKARNDKGFVLVFTALSIVVLCGLGGLAVDVGNWYLNADKLQKSADAASLAGSPYLPGDPGQAMAAAQATLQANGIVSTNTNYINQPVNPVSAPNQYQYTVYMHADAVVPSRLDVQVGIKVHNYLLGLLGVNDEWLARQADSQFREAVPMGSPGNVLGSEPTQPRQQSVQSAEDAFNANYWLNIAGGQTDKVTGDRYTAGKCNNNDDACNLNGTNPEIGAGTGNIRGHQYVVTVPATLSGEPVVLQAFDAASVDVGDHCNDGSTYAQVLGSTQLQSVAVANGDDPSLYAAGPGTYCTGDYDQGFSGTAPALTFAVQKADNFNNPTGSTIGTKTFPGLAYTGNPNTLISDLQSNTKLGSDVGLRDSFRKWATVYTFNAPGTYIVTATTPDSSAGANRFSLRLGIDGGARTASGAIVWDTAAASKVSVYSKHDLTIYDNATAPVSTFYFAKLTDNAAGRRLTVELYDIGDVPSGESVDLKLLAPPHANGSINSTGFQDCAQIGPNTANPAPGTSLPDCTIHNASSGDDPTYNGRVVKMEITVPSDYSCTDTGNNCWMALQMTLHGEVNGSPIAPSNPSTDTTTWQIDDCGNPVKLVTPGSPDDDESCPAAS